jgi:hypothetical protein
MTVKMSPPDLPLDVIVTVAEFLAGDHAFETLAALNQASRTVKQATLAVLFETLFFDNVDEMDFFQQDNDGNRSITQLNSVRYTKSVCYLCDEPDANFSSLARFLFCVDRYRVTAQTSETFPNLVAVIDDTGRSLEP